MTRTTQDRRDETSARELTDEEREALEMATNPLIDLVAWVERRRPTSSAYDDPRFLAWLAAEGREHPRARAARARASQGAESDRLTDAQLARIAERVRERVVALLCGVQNARGLPPSVPAPAPGLVREVLAAVWGDGYAPLVELSVAAGAGRELWESECDAVVPLPAAVPRGRHLVLGVSGDSMEPLLHDGDRMLVRLGEECDPDSVVVARAPSGGYVVKRVGRVSPRRVELLSLNAAYEPVRVRREPGAVLGTVLLRWCPHGDARGALGAVGA